MGHLPPPLSLSGYIHPSRCSQKILVCKVFPMTVASPDLFPLSCFTVAIRSTESGD